MPHVVAKGRRFRGSTKRRVRWPKTSLAWDAVRKHHAWVAAFDAFDADRPRFARCLLQVFDALQIFFGAAVACWFVVLPRGVCRGVKDEGSCVNVDSFFGAAEMCDWDGGRDPECDFKATRGHDRFVLDLQVAVLGLAIALPLVALLEWTVERFLFAPTLDEGTPVEPGDVDGDTFEDVVVGTADGQMSYWKGSAQGTFTLVSGGSARGLAVTVSRYRCSRCSSLHRCT